jgi:hypothetical protein
LEEAAKREAMHRRSIAAQKQEAVDIERLAETMVRDERINARAATRARMLRNSDN